VRRKVADRVNLPARDKEATLPSHSKERDQAEARFQKAQKAAHDAREARSQYEADARAMREKTVRLKALRLAKEAADLAAAELAAADLAAPTGKRAAKKPVAAK
jgi:hypothetical protein